MKDYKIKKISPLERTVKVRKDTHKKLNDSKDKSHNQDKKFRDTIDLKNQRHEKNSEAPKKEEGNESEKMNPSIEEIKEEMEGRNLGKIHKLVAKLENDSEIEGINHLKELDKHQTGKRQIQAYEKNIIVQEDEQR